ncbi:MAG TPA: response regulator [Bacteroidetes bacterium]|nr:response regulator [Bacteroidota bacterium]
MKTLDLVLLVEDDDLVNFYNEFLLKELNIAKEVVIARNGREGLDYLEKCDANPGECPYPDLILLDINMPIMNGFEFMEEYENRELDRRAKMLVVMLTTSMHPQDRERANSFPSIYEYLYKPLLETAILPVVNRYFENIEGN